MKALKFALEGLDELIQAKEDTYKGQKFKDPSRRQAGQTFWAKVKANPYKWLKDHPDANPGIVKLVKQIAAKKRAGKY
jgi:hypothetical protein